MSEVYKALQVQTFRNCWEYSDGLGPKAWTEVKLGKPQALIELSDSRPSEPGFEVLGSMGEVPGLGGKPELAKGFEQRMG